MEIIPFSIFISSDNDVTNFYVCSNVLWCPSWMYFKFCWCTLFKCSFIVTLYFRYICGSSIVVLLIVVIKCVQSLTNNRTSFVIYIYWISITEADQTVLQGRIFAMIHPTGADGAMHICFEYVYKRQFHTHVTLSCMHYKLITRLLYICLLFTRFNKQLHAHSVPGSA